MHHHQCAANGIHHAAGNGVRRCGRERIYLADGAVEVGGFERHRLFHQVKTGHDGAAEIMIVFRQRVGGYGGAAADDDAGVLREAAAAQRIKPAVGAMLLRAAVMVADTQSLPAWKTAIRPDGLIVLQPSLF